MNLSAKLTESILCLCIHAAFNPGTGATTQGDSVAEAITNLKEATELYLEEFPLESPMPALMTTFEVVSLRNK